MATWPSGKAKVCNTYITSSNLVVASLNSLITRSFFIAKMYVESVYLRIKFSRTGAVSYTHLDVYKRQLSDANLGNIASSVMALHANAFEFIIA